MASTATTRRTIDGPAFKAWRERIGLSTTKMAALLHSTHKTVESWESRHRNFDAPAVAAIGYIECMLNRQPGRGVPEHLIGYDPDTGSRYVVRLMVPGLVMGTNGKPLWLDPPSEYDDATLDAAIALAKLALRNL